MRETSLSANRRRGLGRRRRSFSHPIFSELIARDKAENKGPAAIIPLAEDALPCRVVMPAHNVSLRNAVPVAVIKRLEFALGIITWRRDSVFHPRAIAHVSAAAAPPS